LSHIVNHAIIIHISARRRWFALGPGWAVVAAALTAALQYTPLAGGETSRMWLLQVGLLWLLADPILGTIWHVLIDQDMLRQLRRLAWQSNVVEEPALPYVTRQSPAYRLLLWRAALRSQVGSGWQTLLILSVAALALAGWLNRWALAWVAVSLVLALWLGQHNSQRGHRQQIAQSVGMYLLPYLAGVVVFHSISLGSVLLGVSYWIVYLGCLRLWAGQIRGASLLVFGQAAAALLLLALVKPLAAVTVILSIVFALLLRNDAEQHSPARWEQWASAVQPFLLASLLISAGAMGGIG